jgi:hypothetical protein
MTHGGAIRRRPGLSFAPQGRVRREAVLGGGDDGRHARLTDAQSAPSHSCP